MSVTHMEPRAAVGGGRPSEYRDLLVHVEPTEAGQARLKAAVDLARRCEATLVGVGAATLDPMVYSDPSGMASCDLAFSARNILAEDLARARRMFDEATQGLDARWLCLDAVPIEAVIETAREADLIVAGGAAPEHQDHYRHASTGELILKSGRPVLVVPSDAAPLRAETVVVAWKDTREARRAVADAMPFLRAARSVVVVEVCAAADAADATSRTAAVAEHLRRHGVSAFPLALASEGDPAAIIRSTARENRADLLVLGGYGHSRLGEWVFGGVTHDLLDDCAQYLLMSH